MRAMNCGLLASVLCLLAVTTTTAASTGKNATAQRCGVDQDEPAQRIFADPDGKHGWREFQQITDVPELELGFGESARLWAGGDGNLLIRAEEPGEDFAAYTDYCFNKAGQLVQIRFELRTAWGWGYRQEGPIAKGSIVAQTSEFFSTKTGESITKPDQAADVADALRPHLYLLKSQLPFSKLLSRRD
jgi:hypothetical protein